MKITNKTFNRAIAIILSLIMIFSMVPTYIAFAADSDSVATVTAFVGGVVAKEDDVDTVTFKNVTLNWSDVNESIGRNVAGWWVGMKVIAPDDMSEEQLKKAKYINSSNNERNFWDYKDSANGAEQHYIEMWSVLNESKLNDAILNGSNVEFVYKFDWNNDDTYEQTIKMIVEPSGIKLQKDGATVYPSTTENATVNTITNGISASENGSNIVTIKTEEDVVLKWVAKDESIGRGYDGWWIGYNVVAPDGWNTEKASYQHKSSTGWNTDNTVLFKDAKDTDNSIQVWRLLNETYLNDAVKNEKTVNYITRYDWDGDGVYEQVIQLKVDPSDVTLLSEDGKEQRYPDISEEFTVKGFEGVYDGKEHTVTLTYDSSKYTAKYIVGDETFDNIKNVTYTDVINQIVSVAFYRGEVLVCKKETTINITPAEMDDVKVLAPDKKEYDGTESPLFIVEGVVEGDIITYTEAGLSSEYIVPKLDEGIKKVEIATKKYIPGNYKLNVIVTRKNYKELNVDVEYKIESGTLDTSGLTINVNENLVYNGEEQTLLSASDFDEGKYKIKYQVVSDNASFDPNGLFTEYAKKSEAGVYTVYIVAFKANYNDKLIFSDETAEPPIPYTVTINQSEQSGFGFEKEQKELVVFDDFVAIEATGGQTDEKITYEVIEGAEYVELHPDGNIKAIKSNTDNNASVTVKAIRKGNSNYKDVEATYTVKVVKADLTIEFEKTPEAIYYNDNNNFKYEIVEQTFDCDCEHNCVYSIKEDTFPKEYKPNIDKSTGEVTYNILPQDSATITVKAEVASCDHYVGAYTEYTIALNHIDAPEIFITDPDHVDDSKLAWYGCDVIIKENDPDKEWDITEGNNAAGKDESEWLNEIKETDEGKYAPRIIAFCDTNGNITKEIKVDAFNIDKTNPAIDKFVVDDVTITEKVISFLSFGIFGQDQVKIFVEVSDQGISSGIRDVVLYTNENDSEGIIGTYNESEAAYEFTLPEEALNENQKLQFVLSAKVTDNVGYESEKTDMTSENSGLENTNLMIENIKPEIFNVKTTPFEGVKEYNYDKDHLVYNGDFTFNFSVSDVDSGIHSVKVLVNGEDALKKDYTSSGDKNLDEKLNEDNYEITTDKFNTNGDGAYVFEVLVVDNAGNEIPEKYTYYEDTKAPSITEFKFGNESDIDLESDVFVDNYGFWFKDSVDVTVTAEDFKTENVFKSDLKSITIYLYDVDEDKYYTVYEAAGSYFINDIDDIAKVNTIAFDDVKAKQSVIFTVPANFKGQIYAFATDNVDNSGKYTHPDASVVEDINKHENTSNITIAPTANEVGTQNNSYAFEYTGEAEILDEDKDYDDEQLVPLYKGADPENEEAVDVVFDVTVTDTYSGIRDVKWTIFEGEPVDGIVPSVSDGITIGSDGKFVNNENKGWVIEENTNENIDTNLVTKITKSIEVSGNHNDMVLLVELTDRAGNTSYDYYVFGIDNTLPVIEIIYDDDKAVNDEQYTDFFKTDREATIIITERNFKAEDIVSLITNTDKVIPNVDLTDIDMWTKVVDEDNLDATTYTAKIKYNADGDYTFEINYTDNAGNSNNGIKCESIAPYAFTIDKTAPTVKVEYDNNDVANGNYYKADRTATITVTEHNFDASRFILESIATDNGAEVSFPSITGWKTEGDVHVTTITYSADAKYTFDFTFKDKASNEIADFATQEFYVDKTNPVLSISGIVDQSANNDEGNIGFTITSTDTNFDRFLPILTAVLYNDGNFETKQISLGSAENIPNGKQYVVSNIEADGIYSITCTVVDKAGNAYTQVILENADGKQYVEKRAGNDKLTTFSVNRDGSTFTLNDYTQKLVDDYYVQDVTDKVTIIEINADPILEETVTLNGKTLVKGTDYSVSLDNSEGTWYKYSYSINKELFADENEYNVVVSSKDKATNEAFSDVKNLTVKFVVDRTAPTITVTGLKSNGRYQVEKQKVTLSPSDDGGMLKTLIVRTVDENGNVLKEIINLSGDELIAALESGEITFELTETEELYQYIQIISEDFAGNIVGANDDEIYSNVTVTTNAFLIFWANQPLRWGSIAGVILLTAAIIFLIVRKKRNNTSK